MMLVVDHTAELSSIFASLRRSDDVVPSARQQSAPASSPTDAWTLPALRAHPLWGAVALTTTTQAKAATNAQRKIRSTLSTLDSIVSFSCARLEGQLLLCEAELASVSATITELLPSLEKAKEECARQQRSGASAPAPRRRGGSSEAIVVTRLPPLGFLDHLCEALGVLRSRNAHWRQLVALCKEELALYRSETALFARCGVSSCEPADLPPCDRERTSHGADAPSAVRGSLPITTSSGRERGDGQGRTGFGLASGVARGFMRVDHLMKGALPASFSTLGSTVGGGLEGLRGAVSSAGDAAARTLPPLPAPPRFRYAAEEEERLREQQRALVEKQQAASAHDARLVEASVRELSQLTTLMNEKVLEQNENFSILMKNTSEAKVYYDKALAELRKAESGSGQLNSTRQLIVLLCVSSLVLLVANWWVK